MTIALTDEQLAWLEARVSQGLYGSLGEGARRLMDQTIADTAAVEADDRAWAAPLVAEAQAFVARGEIVTLEEHRARRAARRS